MLKETGQERMCLHRISMTILTSQIKVKLLHHLRDIANMCKCAIFHLLLCLMLCHGFMCVRSQHRKETMNSIFCSVNKTWLFCKIAPFAAIIFFFYYHDTKMMPAVNDWSKKNT